MGSPYRSPPASKPTLTPEEARAFHRAVHKDLRDLRGAAEVLMAGVIGWVITLGIEWLVLRT